MRVGNEELLPIGRFSQLTGLTAKALRHYDEVGVLRPAHVDGWTGYRWYSLAQAREAEAIRRLRSFELPLDEIAAVLHDETLLRERLAVQRARLEGRAVETARMLAELDRLIHGEEKLVPDEKLDYAIEDVPELTLAAIRRRVPMEELPTAIPQAIGQTAGWVAENGGFRGAPVCVCPPPDDDGLVDLKVGWPVDGSVTPPEPLELWVCEPARAAVHVYTGEFTGLHATWRRLWESLHADGIEPTGEGREHYETSPEEVNDPSEHVTRIVWPL